MSLPRWQCRDRRDALEMTWWVCDELNRMDVEAMRKNLAGENAVESKSWAIEQADRHRNIEPLRQAFPELAKYLQLPKLKHRLPRRGYNPVQGAVTDMKRIRTLWQERYPGKRRTTEPSAETIAAERWEIEVDTVINALKKDAK